MGMNRDTATGKPEEALQTNGATHFTSPPGPFVQYTNGSDVYLCEGKAGTAALSAATWKIIKNVGGTGTKFIEATGTDGVVGSYTNAATSAASVAALTYTMGA
jgi:hypothetical protein